MYLIFFNHAASWKSRSSTLSDDNHTSGNQSTEGAENDKQSVLNDPPHVWHDTIFQLKDVYVALRECYLQSEVAPNQRVLDLESQVIFLFLLCIG